MVDCSSLLDEQLVSLCKSGEASPDYENAWNELSKRYLRVAKAVAASFSGSVLERDDLVGEGMFGFLAAVYSFNEAAGASFSTYVGVCIRNRMLSALKAHKTQRQIPSSLFVPLEDENGTASAVPSPEDELVSKHEAERISKLISSELSSREKEVFTLFLFGNSYREISEKLKITPKAVDGALRRARKKLRASLG